MNARRKGEIMDTETNVQTNPSNEMLISRIVFGVRAGFCRGVVGPNRESGGRLQDWIFDGATERSGASALARAKLSHREIVDESFETTGAVVMGRRWFEILNKFWGDGPPHFQVPCFVITHHARKKFPRETRLSLLSPAESETRSLKQNGRGQQKRPSRRCRYCATIF